MKVRELIEQLGRLDPEAQVVVRAGLNGYHPAKVAHLSLVRLDEPSVWSGVGDYADAADAVDEAEFVAGVTLTHPY